MSRRGLLINNRESHNRFLPRPWVTLIFSRDEATLYDVVSVRLSMLKVEKKGWKDVSISWSSLFGLCPMGYEETWNAFPCCWKVSLVYSLSFQLQLGFLIVTYRSSLHHFSVIALSAIASLDTISMPFVCLWLFSLVGHAAFKNATSFIGNFFCSRQKVSLPSALL